MEEDWTEAVEFSDRAREELAERESEEKDILDENTQREYNEYRRQYNKAIHGLNAFMVNELPEAVALLARLADYVEFLKPQLDKGLRVYRIANGGKVIATSPPDWPEKDDMPRIYIGSRWSKGIVGPVSKSYYLTPRGFGSHEKRRGEGSWGMIVAKIRGHDHFKRIISVKKILGIFCDFEDHERWPNKFLPYLRIELTKRAKVLRFVSEALLKG